MSQKNHLPGGIISSMLDNSNMFDIIVAIVQPLMKIVLMILWILKTIAHKLMNNSRTSA